VNKIPESLNEALQYLKEGTYDVLAGGTDIMLKNRGYAEAPVPFKKNMLYIFNLDELRYIATHDEHIAIGAVTSYASMLRHPDVPDILKRSIRQIAGPALRHVATLAGNIGNASPSADGVLVLYLLDARIILASADGEREVPIEDVITGPGKHTIRPEEMIKEIRLPRRTFSNTFFKKVGARKADAISKTSLAGAARLHDNVVEELRIAIGAVNVTVVRDRSIEASFKGLTLEDLKARVDEVAAAYDSLIRPIDDQRSNARYRKQVSFNLIEAFIRQL